MPLASRAAQSSTNFATRTYGLALSPLRFCRRRHRRSHRHGWRVVDDAAADTLLFGVHPLTAVGTRADKPTRTRYSGPITVVFGALLGVVVSLCSFGAGALGMAVLFFLYPRLPPVRIIGSDLAHAVYLLRSPIGQGRWLADCSASVSLVSWRSCMQYGVQKSPRPPATRRHVGGARATQPTRRGQAKVLNPWITRSNVR